MRPRSVIADIGLLGALVVAGASALPAQHGRTLDQAAKGRRVEGERDLQAIAIVERKVMVPMRDGIRLATDVYRPKGAAGTVPTIFVRTPYDFNFWDLENQVPADMSQALEMVRRGYALVVQNERGRYFSEGNYEILGAPTSDGWDALEWISTQPWSNGKVGTTGCSSTAEYQMAIAALGHPAYAAMNVQGYGAGIGRVGQYYEQGNWFRGGAVQMLFIPWIYGQQHQVRPWFPRTTTREELERAARWFDLAPEMAEVDWSRALWHLPLRDILRAVDGPTGIFADPMPVPTGGNMVVRTPNDPAWYRGGLYHDDMPLEVPGLWMMSWYDVSISPNLALFNHVRAHARPEVAAQQWAIIAPVLHCSFMRAGENTVVGERNMGDARFDYVEVMFGFFDRLLKGEANERLARLPKVTYFTMGKNVWQSAGEWPPAGSTTRTFFLASAGAANSLAGDGALATAPPARDQPDRFVYDPGNPVPSRGGNVCCTGNAITPGSFDQRAVEARHDVLVYTTEPFEDGIELTGPIALELYVSSDRRDTDFTLKVLDVYPDGRAFNLDETIQRMRFRDGYTAPPAWMESGRVYRAVFSPIETSNFFGPGHRLRIEISSSNFPRFDRNLNTGGNNYDESEWLAAHNAVHHSKVYPSRLAVTVAPRPDGDTGARP